MSCHSAFHDLLLMATVPTIYDNCSAFGLIARICLRESSRRMFRDRRLPQLPCSFGPISVFRFYGSYASAKTSAAKNFGLHRLGYARFRIRLNVTAFSFGRDPLPLPFATRSGRLQISRLLLASYDISATSELRFRFCLSGFATPSLARLLYHNYTANFIFVNTFLKNFSQNFGNQKGLTL